MKYFDDNRMRDVRERLEAEILNWPGVSSREMMGCLCYLRGKKMLAFLVTDGIVISKLSDEDQKELEKVGRRIDFKMGSKPIRKPVWAVKSSRDLRLIMPYLRKSYQKTKT